MSKKIHSRKFSDDNPNPFERRQFAFRVLPEEKDPMSRAKHYSFVMPTLTARLQQLITTRLWEYIMLILSIWSFVPLLIGYKLPKMRLFFELTHEITQGWRTFSIRENLLIDIKILAALFIEVFCKIYVDWRWFFYDIWNFYDLICVILNSPFIYNLFLSDHLGIPEMNSIQRLFRTLHAIRLIRIHSLLRFVIETVFIALTSIYHTLLLELIVITVFALLSIALEGDTPFSNANTYEPYENYTEALYSYYMCITLEGVNEVAEHVLQLDSPQFTTVIGLVFYIFAAIVTYSVGQLLSAVVAATLDKAINQITHEKTSLSTSNQNTKLIGLQSPSINERQTTKFRCLNSMEIENFSHLKPDDLTFLIILFQIFDKNLSEHENIIYDIRSIGEYIAELNEKKFISNNQQSSVQQQRLKLMINTLNKILHDLTDEDELLTPFDEFLINEIEKSSNHQHDLNLVYKSIEEKLTKIENKLKKNSLNYQHLHIIDQFKEKILQKYQK